MIKNSMLMSNLITVQSFHVWFDSHLLNPNSKFKMVTQNKTSFQVFFFPSISNTVFPGVLIFSVRPRWLFWATAQLEMCTNCNTHTSACAACERRQRWVFNENASFQQEPIISGGGAAILLRFKVISWSASPLLSIILTCSRIWMCFCN